MIRKKSDKGDLEMRRGTFLLIGLVVVLALVYAGFELFATAERANEMVLADDDTFIIVEDNIINTDVQPPQTPPDPMQNKEVVIETVSNLIKVQPTFDFTQNFDQFEAIEDIHIEILEEPVDLPPPVYWVDEMPEFPGGEEAWNEYLRKELRYPEVCRTLGITGVVHIEFVVERDGAISNIRVLEPVYRDLDAEAVRVISASPKWKAGKQMGKAVRVFYQIPIRFSLN
jgi:protein TonB